MLRPRTHQTQPTIGRYRGREDHIRDIVRKYVVAPTFPHVSLRQLHACLYLLRVPHHIEECLAITDTSLHDRAVDLGALPGAGEVVHYVLAACGMAHQNDLTARSQSSEVFDALRDFSDILREIGRAEAAV